MSIKPTVYSIPFLVALSALLLVPSVQARWYDATTLKKGGILFQQHCAACHQPDASGTRDWKKPNKNGQYPPPPLNGSAHAWHHDLALLKQIIRDGGAPMGGVMPSFADKLNDRQIEAVIAYFQSKWPDQIYDNWASRGKPGELPGLQ